MPQAPLSGFRSALRTWRGRGWGCRGGGCVGTQTGREVTIDIDQHVQVARIAGTHGLGGLLVHKDAQGHDVRLDLVRQLIFRLRQIGLYDGPQQMVKAQSL